MSLSKTLVVFCCMHHGMLGRPWLEFEREQSACLQSRGAALWPREATCWNVGVNHRQWGRTAWDVLFEARGFVNTVTDWPSLW